ncbi:MAG: hypothetical protein PHO10_01070, partial [Gemmiger sp.]|nr:hypothetical protein [Gemmiger sp.]
ATNVLCERPAMLRNYFVLEAIGYSFRLLEKALLYQLLILFAVPLATAAILSFCMTLAYARSSGMLLFVPFFRLLLGYCTALVLFMLLYAIYFIISFISLRKSYLAASGAGVG